MNMQTNKQTTNQTIKISKYQLDTYPVFNLHFPFAMKLVYTRGGTHTHTHTHKDVIPIPDLFVMKGK